MSKKNNKSNVFKKIISFFDTIIITPISKTAFFIKDKCSIKSGTIDKLLNKPNVLLYLSLALAFLCFFMVDRKAIGVSNTEAIVLSNQSINVEYNEEAYVIEGIPESADIVLMGRKSDLYLAQQLGNHTLNLDLTDYKDGTYKVNLVYNNPINTLNYKLDPSTVTVIVFPKVSEVRSLSKDVINTDKLSETLVVTNVVLDRDEVIIKSYEEKLSKVANVKAIVDVNLLDVKEAGTYTLSEVKLIAYDENGKEIKGIEIVPSTVSATITITSPSKSVPLTVVPKGEVRSGSAIASIVSSVNNVTIYADESILNEINFIQVEIDVEDLKEGKVFQKVINKPTGARSISETSVTITVTMEEETSKNFENINIETENLDSKFVAQASSQNDASVTVTVKGVKSLLDQLESTDIKAYVDLSNIHETGSVTVPVYVTGKDLKLTYISKTQSVNLIIIDK